MSENWQQNIFLELIKHNHGRQIIKSMSTSAVSVRYNLYLIMTFYDVL